MGYRPASLVIEILGAKGKLPEENINKVIEFMPEVFLSCLTSGAFMVCLIMPFYIFARWGHDPKGTYQSLTRGYDSHCQVERKNPTHLFWVFCL